MTREWWDNQANKSELWISEFVLEELEAGDMEAAAKRVKVVEGITLLHATESSEKIAGELIQNGLIPANVPQDAAHVAMATIYEADVLLTWNCNHLANIAILRRMEAFIRSLGYEPPIICTPEELLGDDHV